MINRPEGNHPDFDIDLERGKVGEELVATILGQFSNGATFEVKTDYKVSKTGNLYIEIFQFGNRDRSDARPSGIQTTKADWWVFVGGDSDKLMPIFVKTSDILELIITPDGTSWAYETKPQAETSARTNGSWGVIVPMRELLKLGGYKV